MPYSQLIARALSVSAPCDLGERRARVGLLAGTAYLRFPALWLHAVALRQYVGAGWDFLYVNCANSFIGGGERLGLRRRGCESMHTAVQHTTQRLGLPENRHFPVACRLARHPTFSFGRLGGENFQDFGAIAECGKPSPTGTRFGVFMMFQCRIAYPCNVHGEGVAAATRHYVLSRGIVRVRSCARSPTIESRF